MKTSTKNEEIIFEQRTNEVTIDELRELDSFKNYNEEQVKELINTMKTFAGIVYQLCANEIKLSNSKGSNLVTIKPPESINIAA